MPNKLRQEANKSTRVAGGTPKPKKSFMDRVRELAKMDGTDGKPENKPQKGNPEGQKGARLQEIQERAIKIESE